MRVGARKVCSLVIDIDYSINGWSIVGEVIIIIIILLGSPKSAVIEIILDFLGSL
jgi:hypothetical protein